MTKREKVLATLRSVEPQAIGTAIGSLQKCDRAVKEIAKRAQPDRTVTLTARLSAGTRPGEAALRGSVSLPNGVGKAKRVAVFAQPERSVRLRELGAAAAGGQELAAIIKDGSQEFDVVLASPDMMGVVGPLGRFLGPKGLMPSPKSGTVTDDLEGTLAEFIKGRVEFRADPAGNLHIPVGKMSFTTEALEQNIVAAQAAIDSTRQGTHKNVFVKAQWVSATMLPAYQLADSVGGTTNG